MVAACGQSGPPASHAPPPAPARVAAADPARGITTTLDGVAPLYSEGALAELSGDDAAARAAYDKLLAASDAPPPIAARAALHLAQLEARAGKTHHALDLGARAAALAPNDVAVAEGLAQLRADVVAASGTGDGRGPPIGTPLPGADPRVADAFADAERALAVVRRFQPRAFEILLGANEDATEGVVARYRAVAEHGGLAQIASDYRIGSLYHDLALGFLIELPGQLDPRVAAGIRGTLRGRAIAYLKRAVTAYEACLAGPALPDAELWRLAAETDLRAAREVLAEAGE
ncbi:MAG TPA: hypothetical protein VLX92_30660 [Kofleriaceae bacterium]|nr:hypothetical protein [Kofleriaceae bacterium]